MAETATKTSGPLSGIKVIEMAGKGPAPYCGMLLSDMGADVIRIDRISAPGRRFDHYVDPMSRGRRSVAVDLKNPAGVETVLGLVTKADALIEGYRPGVMERFGLGPEDCEARNPKLVYGRVTGWGQEGPLAQAAGHDLNYMAITGTLNAIGDADLPPPAPLALVADFGGGGMFLALGVVSAILEARKSAKGQVVDAAMIEGVASLSTFTHGLNAAGWWQDQRQSNMLDGGAHFYRNYATKDNKYISLAPIEPEFYAQFIALMGIDESTLPKKMDRNGWPEWRRFLELQFLSKTRDEWCAILEGTDACFAPVLSFEEAPSHPQNKARETFIDYQGVTQPAPSPRFSRTPSAIQRPAPAAGEHSQEILKNWGFDDAEVRSLIEDGAVGSSQKQIGDKGGES
jgi:alpha-methylacyl-CoA racemase